MFDISSGTILDVAIGLTLMYLMISLVATAVNEMFATVIKLRPKYLVKAMELILDNESLKKAFYDFRSHIKRARRHRSAPVIYLKSEFRPGADQ